MGVPPAPPEEHELTFTVGGESFSARVSSMRKLRWDSMKVNFFVIGPPGLVGRFPASYISAFRLAPGDEGLMNELAARFPQRIVVLEVLETAVTRRVDLLTGTRCIERR